MSEIVIRNARASDAPILENLLVQLNAADTGSWTTESIPQVIAEIDQLDGAHLLVAEIDDVIAGTATVTIAPSIARGARPWAQIESVVVDEAFRRRGIARALLLESFRIAEGAGCYKAQLTTNVDNETAHALYSSIGMTQNSVAFKTYWMDDGDAK